MTKKNKDPMLTGIGKLRRMTNDGNYKDKGYYMLLLNKTIKFRSVQGQIHRPMSEINEHIISLERITKIHKPISMSDTDPHPARYFDAQGITRIRGNGVVLPTSNEEHSDRPSVVNNAASAGKKCEEVGAESTTCDRLVLEK